MLEEIVKCSVAFFYSTATFGEWSFATNFIRLSIAGQQRFISHKFKEPDVAVSGVSPISILYWYPKRK